MMGVGTYMAIVCLYSRFWSSTSQTCQQELHLTVTLNYAYSYYQLLLSTTCRM